MQTKIRLLLVITLLVMSVLPALCVLYFFDDLLSSQSQIYNNPSLRKTLDQAQDHLKELSKFKPEGESTYKEQFDAIQDLKLIYEDDDFFSTKLISTYSKYFFVIFLAFVTLALLFGFLLSFFIDALYKDVFQKLQKEKDKNAYLQEMARWQEVAKKLAHEIRRPLMPIRTWISYIQNSFAVKALDEFATDLQAAIYAIHGELQTLTTMVQEFAKFGTLPKAQAMEVDLKEFLKNFCRDYADIWPNTKLNLSSDGEKIIGNIDASLFRQVLVNLIENASQANSKTQIVVDLEIYKTANGWEISVFNSGIEIVEDDRERIFELYHSTKQDQENMGLGLSIVRYLLVEQGCEIKNVHAHGGAKFLISTGE